MDILPCKGSQKTTRSSIRTISNTQEKIYITFLYRLDKFVCLLGGV